MGLERYLQTWEILLIYCNSQLKKLIAPLLRLVRGSLSSPFWCLCQKHSLSLFIVINLLPHKSPEWPRLVSHSKTISSLEIINPTSFTVSYQYIMKWQLKKCYKERKVGWRDTKILWWGWGYLGVMWYALDKENLESPLSRRGSTILLLLTSGWQSALWTLFSSSIRRGLNRTAPNNDYPLNPLFRRKSSLTSIRTFGPSGATLSYPCQLHLNLYNASFIDKKSQCSHDLWTCGLVSSFTINLQTRQPHHNLIEM